MAELLETSYDHIKGTATFTITAAETWSIAMVRRLKRQHPQDVEILAENTDGSLLAHMPVEWMRIIPKRSIILSEAERTRRALQLHRAVQDKTSAF